MIKSIFTGLIIVYVAWISVLGYPFGKYGISQSAEKKEIKAEKGGNTMSKVIELRDEDFDQEVLTATSPVIVDFFATWCGPCKMQHPVLEQFAEEFAGKVKVAKLDVDASETKAREYKIRSVPTLMIFKGGKVVETMLGYHSKEELEAAVSKHW